MDPYKAAEDAYEQNKGLGRHQMRAAITAALVAERKRTIGYWLRRARQLVIWFGGWEKANCGGWDMLTNDGRLRSPTPVSVMRVYTHYGWGWQFRLFATILVKSPDGVYFSPDGTPNKATRWMKRPKFF